MIQRLIAVTAVLALLLAAPAQLPADEVASSHPPMGKQPATISMDVTQAYLEDVLKLLSKQAGMNFVASDSVRDKKITLFFDRVPISDALDTILRANGLTITSQRGKNLFVVTKSGAPEIPLLTRVYQLKYARVVPSAGEVTQTFGLTGSLITETFGSSTGAGGTSTTGSSGSGITGGGLGGGLGGGFGGGTGNANQNGILHVIKTLLTDHGSVVADPRTNSLIVMDIPERIKVIDETVAKLDVKPKQIYIEAEVLEVTLDTLRRLGIEYGDPTTGQVASYAGPVRASFFPLARGFLGNAATSTTGTNTLGTLALTDMNVLLKLLATEKDVRFLARPRLLTLSNEVAEIRIVTEAVTGVTSSSQTQTGTVTSSPERTTVGTILRVTPMVNDSRYITMIIEPEVSRAIQSSSFSSFLDPNRRVARTTVMIPDGGTAMIAGLISSENTNGARRIPVLGDLPLLGLPFKRTDTEKKSTEILLFITPHIVDENTVETKPRSVKEREQSPLLGRQERTLEEHRKRITKERAVTDTLDNITW